MNVPFSKVPTRLLLSQAFTKEEKVLLCVMFGYAPRVFPSHAHLANLTGMSKSSVNKTLQRLKALGILSWIKGKAKGTNNLYKLNTEALLEYSYKKRKKPTKLKGDYLSYCDNEYALDSEIVLCNAEQAEKSYHENTQILDENAFQEWLNF